MQVTRAYKSMETPSRVSGSRGVSRVAPRRADAAMEDVVKLSDAAKKAGGNADAKMRARKVVGLGPVSASRVLSLALVRFRAAEVNSFHEVNARDRVVTSAGEEISVKARERATVTANEAEEVEHVSTSANDDVVVEVTQETAPARSSESTESSTVPVNLGRYVETSEEPPSVNVVA